MYLWRGKCQRLTSGYIVSITLPRRRNNKIYPRKMREGGMNV